MTSNKCVITRSGTAKSCHIILCNKAVASDTHTYTHTYTHARTIIRLQPDRRHDAINKNVKLWYVHGEGGGGGDGGAACKKKKKKISNCIAPSTSHPMIWSFLKWIRGFGSELAPAGFRFFFFFFLFVRLCQMASFYASPQKLTWFDSTATDDEMGGGVGVVVYSFK